LLIGACRAKILLYHFQSVFSSTVSLSSSISSLTTRSPLSCCSRSDCSFLAICSSIVSSEIK
uniref:Secreted protein n=1 Tax=Haemonchus placei TaxID=6290 RepID=A0A158QP17_HAEPC